MPASEAGKEWANSGIRVKRVSQFLASAPAFGTIPIFLYELHRTMASTGRWVGPNYASLLTPGRHPGAEA